MPKGIRWGGGSFGSPDRLRKQLEKARQFTIGEVVRVGNLKGKVVEITATGGVMVRIGGGKPIQHHPDHVQKIVKS